MEIIPRPVKGVGLGELGGAGGFGMGGKRFRPQGCGVGLLPSRLPVPADALQLTSAAHAVPQADETLGKALVYGVTAAWARCGCCQGRYKDWGWGWRIVDRIRRCALTIPPTPAAKPQGFVYQGAFWGCDSA